MNTESHQFKEYQKIYVQHVAKDKKKGMPRGIMLASVFHSDSRAMEASLAKGELQSHKDDAGMEYLSFRELRTIEVKTNERGETVEGFRGPHVGGAHVEDEVGVGLQEGRVRALLSGLAFCHYLSHSGFLCRCCQSLRLSDAPGCPPPITLKVALL